MSVPVGTQTDHNSFFPSGQDSRGDDCHLISFVPPRQFSSFNLRFLGGRISSSSPSCSHERTNSLHETEPFSGALFTLFWLWSFKDKTGVLEEVQHTLNWEWSYPASWDAYWSIRETFFNYWRFGLHCHGLPQGRPFRFFFKVIFAYVTFCGIFF